MMSTQTETMTQDEREALADSVARLLGGTDDPWPQLVEHGFAGVGLPEAYGGSGGGWEDAAVVLEAAAYATAPVPLAENTWLAAWALAEVGAQAPAATATLATGSFSVSGSHLRGRAVRIPFLRAADELVVVTHEGVYRVAPGACQVTPGANLAGEPRDDVIVDGSVEVLGPGPSPAEVQQRGALARTVQLAGAARRALDHSVTYVREREQFGRPIGAFQAVQQQLSVLAAEAFIVDVSARSAVRAAAADERSARIPIAAAKSNASRGAQTIVRIAHQLHGAIGVTHEHDLHLATSRLSSWAREYGTANYWTAELGAWSEAADPWHFITGTTESP